MIEFRTEARTAGNHHHLTIGNYIRFTTTDVDALPEIEQHACSVAESILDVLDSKMLHRDTAVGYIGYDGQYHEVKLQVVYDDICDHIICRASEWNR